MQAEDEDNTVDNDQKVTSTGDATDNPLRMVEKFDELFTQYDKNHDGLIDYDEWNEMIHLSDETALSHLSDNDAHMLFTILSKQSGFVRYPELVEELTLAAQQNSTMPANEFINSFFARFMALQQTRHRSTYSPMNLGLSRLNTSSRLLETESVETLQKKYEGLKQQWKEKEMEWKEEKIGLETQIKRFELENEQLKTYNEEVENELKKWKEMEMEHYAQKEDKNVMKEQLFEMEDDIRRFYEDLERANTMNLHLKQQRILQNEKQDFIQDLKLAEMKLQMTQIKFDEMCDKHRSALLQIEEMEQLHKQQ
ncbi:caldesmon, partial [Reticulomyxa filosa]